MRLVKSMALGLVLALMGMLQLSAQDRTVSGRIVDQSGQPVSGVAILHAGTRNGVTTELDGTFRITLPVEAVTLNISSMGYVSQDIRIPAGQATVSIVLVEDSTLLDETVVVGYGTQKKVNLTGAVSAVRGEELTGRSAHSISSMLQGSVPGLYISSTGGDPASSNDLNVRGYTSINGASPLVLIDGTEGNIDRVNPADVESISVLKDASAAAVYGARAAFGVILVTTKNGSETDGKAKITYSGKFGWESPTTSTDYETRGYWSVYTLNKFRTATLGSNYVLYDDYDMQQLLLRVNDKTENPDRPWVVLENRNGRDQWVYYGNTDWWHSLFTDNHPTQTHSVLVTGGNKNIKYAVSGGYDRQVGIVKVNPDVYQRYNLRSKLDIRLNKYARLANTTSFYGSTYNYISVSNIENAIAYSAAHALPIFPLQNPDGSWVYLTPYLNGSYAVANGRHIVYGEGKDKNVERKTDFTNTTQLTVTPVKTFSLVANFTYRLYQNRYTRRTTNIPYRTYPDQEMQYYTTGAGLDELTESANTYQRYTANIYGTYEETFGDAHHVTVMAGGNYETWNSKLIGASGQNLLSEVLNDLSLVGVDDDGNSIMTVSGGQNEYALLGFFGRINYDYKGKYLIEFSGRYDGSSRFARGHRWGFFPSASAGWRISEEPFFGPVKPVVNNLKLRASYGSLGNQTLSDYYPTIQSVSISNFSSYSFGESSTVAKYASLSSPNSSNLTWETAAQWNIGVDASLWDNRLDFTAEAYIRDTKNMLTDGKSLPSVYGADAPMENAADLRTKGLEFSLGWKDDLYILGHRFCYNLRATMSTFDSEITKFDNPEKSLAMSYYEGMKLGEIWGFVTDGLFPSDEAAQAYAAEVDLSYISARLDEWKGGDLKYLDLDGDGVIGIGSNTVVDPGDRIIIGNSIPRLQYSFNFGFDYFGFDFSILFAGTGNVYWYPDNASFAFWGPYSQPMTSYLPVDFLDDVWDYDNTDAYFPRARAYTAYTSGAYLYYANTRYLQNIRYLRLKNLTFGYTIPVFLTRKIGVEKVRVYLSGENLAYWSPLKKRSIYIDPEAAYVSRNSDYNRAFYPWQRTYMFGIDVTF